MEKTMKAAFREKLFYYVSSNAGHGSQPRRNNYSDWSSSQCHQPEKVTFCGKEIV